MQGTISSGHRASASYQLWCGRWCQKPQGSRSTLHPLLSPGCPSTRHKETACSACFVKLDLPLVHPRWIALIASLAFTQVPKGRALSSFLVTRAVLSGHGRCCLPLKDGHAPVLVRWGLSLLTVAFHRWQGWSRNHVFCVSWYPWLYPAGLCAFGYIQLP